MVVYHPGQRCDTEALYDLVVLWCLEGLLQISEEGLLVVHHLGNLAIDRVELEVLKEMVAHIVQDFQEIEGGQGTDPLEHKI